MPFNGLTAWADPRESHLTRTGELKARRGKDDSGERAKLFIVEVRDRAAALANRVMVEVFVCQFEVHATSAEVALSHQVSVHQGGEGSIHRGFVDGRKAGAGLGENLFSGDVSSTSQRPKDKQALRSGTTSSATKEIGRARSVVGQGFMQVTCRCWCVASHDPAFARDVQLDHSNIQNL